MTENSEHDKQHHAEHDEPQVEHDMQHHAEHDESQDEHDRQQAENDEQKVEHDEQMAAICGVDSSDTKTKPKKKKKKKKVEQYSKAVETMYRNAYRSQLDLISLAATKANIMISLNGFIVSILLVSGSVLFQNSPDFMIPITIFLITSVTSIYFALSSASPEVPERSRKLFPCLREVLLGHVPLKEFNNFRREPLNEFDRKNSNILVFDDYAKISKEVYLECMHELILDSDSLYSKMSDQLYYFGKVAHKKFTLLRYSYTAFRWGLIISILSFFVIKTSHFLFPQTSVAPTEIISGSKIMTFDKIYEPSGIQSLPDGRIVLVEDEASSALHILELQDDETFIEDVRLSKKLLKAFPKLNDLEAITMGPDGYLYALTSHQRSSNGDRIKSREVFLRFKIEGKRVLDIATYRGLVDDIETSGILGETDEQGNGGIYHINIEAMSFNKEGHLMIGFREPLSGDKTIFGIMENPAEVLKNNAKPVIKKKPILLDLNGGGVRAMMFDPALNGYLLTNEVYVIGKANKKHSQMLFWDGTATHRPQYMNSCGLSNIEGISTVQIGGEQHVLLVSDNGKKVKNKAANYVFRQYAQLTK